MSKDLNRIVQLETEIYISIKKHEDACAALLNYLESSPTATPTVEDTPPTCIPDLTTVLASLGYASSHTLDGSIRWVKKLSNDLCIKSEIEIWRTLAEYIEDGSFITFGVEDGEVWAWVFVRNKLHEISLSFCRKTIIKGLVTRATT